DLDVADLGRQVALLIRDLDPRHDGTVSSAALEREPVLEKARRRALDGRAPLDGRVLGPGAPSLIRLLGEAAARGPEDLALSRESGGHATPGRDGAKIEGLRRVGAFLRGPRAQLVEHRVVPGRDVGRVSGASDREDLLLLRDADQRVLLVRAHAEERGRLAGRDEHGLRAVRDDRVDEIGRRRVEETSAPVGLDEKDGALAAARRDLDRVARSARLPGGVGAGLRLAIGSDDDRSIRQHRNASDLIRIGIVEDAGSAVLVDAEQKSLRRRPREQRAVLRLGEREDVHVLRLCEDRALLRSGDAVDLPLRARAGVERAVLPDEEGPDGFLAGLVVARRVPRRADPVHDPAGSGSRIYVVRLVDRERGDLPGAGLPDHARALLAGPAIDPPVVPRAEVDAP